MVQRLFCRLNPAANCREKLHQRCYRAARPIDRRPLRAGYDNALKTGYYIALTSQANAYDHLPVIYNRPDPIRHNIKHAGQFPGPQPHSPSSDPP